MKLLKNNGFSFVELMVGVGLLGAISLGVSFLLKNTKDQSQKFSNKMERKNQTVLIAQEYSKASVCSGQFKNKPLTSPNIPELRSGSRVLLAQGATVLNGQYVVEKIETLPLDKTKFQLKITYRETRQTSGAPLSAVETLAIAADVDEANNLIKHCYDQTADLDTTGICQGPGIIDNGDGTCTIKNFSEPYKVCNVGEAFSILSNVATSTYGVTCLAPFENTKNCQHDLIKHYSPAGVISCLDLANHVDSSTTVVADGSTCGIVATTDYKMKFTCAAGGSSCLPPNQMMPVPAALTPGTGGLLALSDPDFAPTSPACCAPRPDCSATAFTASYSCSWDADGCASWSACVTSHNNPCLAPSGGTTTSGGGASGGSGGGGSCFIAGTQIVMKSGELKNIEEIQLGDQLLNGSGQVVTVMKLLPRSYSGEIYSINGGGHFFTPNHPFKTVQGWKSIDPQATRQESPDLKVSKLRVGDVLIKSQGLELVVALDAIMTNEMVYNFSLSGDREYIANDYIVHNKHYCQISPDDPCCSGTGTCLSGDSNP